MQRPRCRVLGRLLGSTALGVALGAAGVGSALAQTVGINQQFNNQYGLAMIGAGAAYTAGFTGAGVIVAVGDSGFATTQAPFSATGKIDPRSMNYLLPKAGDPYVTTQLGPLTATDDHGSHVSGIVAAANDQNATVGTHGVAFDATLVLLRMVAGRTNVAAPDININADPLNYLATLNNVRIFNASYGPSPPDGSPPLSVWPASFVDTTETAAAQNALAAGKIIVAATGNERGDHPVAGRNPSGLALYPFMQPANANANVYADGNNRFDFSVLLNQPGSIVGVMAVDSNKAAASFSNLCGVTASWCVAAPGIDILSVVPTSVNPAGFATQSGTSQATPHVSGALAVLSQAYPAYTSQDLTRLLFATTEDLGAAGVDATFGYGLIRLDRAIAGPTTLAAGADVNVAAFQTTYWSRALTTAGAFNKTGAGNLIIGGVTTAGGPVGINVGAVAVDGTLNLGANTLSVQQGAMLAGFGQINGTTTIAGTLSPGQLPNVQDQVANNGLAANTAIAGTSPGTLTFRGNVTLAATATTNINVDGALVIPGGPGTFSKIIVTGTDNTFTMGGTLTPVMRNIPGGNNNYAAPIGTKYQFVTAQSGARATGEFTAITQPTVGLPANARFDAIYTAQAVSLSVTPTQFAAIQPAQPLTTTQQEIGAALDVVRGTKSLAAIDSDPLFEDLFALSDANAYAAALTELASPGAAATPGAVLQGFAAFGNVIANRQSALVFGSAGVQASIMPGTLMAFGRRTDIETHPSAMMAFAGIGPADTLPGRNTTSVWGQAFGRWSRIGATSEAPGAKSSSGGFVLGADRVLATDWLAGVAFGFTRTHTTSDVLHADSDTYSGAVYTTWAPGRFVFDGRAVVGPATTATTRTLDFMPGLIAGSAHGIGALFAGEAGYRIAVANTTIKPFAGLDVLTLRRSTYTETQEAGLTYPAQTFTKVMSKIGAATNTRFDVDGVSLLPEVRAAWGHDLRDSTLVTHAALLDTPFIVNAAAPGRDVALIDLSLTAWRSSQLRVFASASGEFRRNASNEQIAGGFRYAW